MQKVKVKLIEKPTKQEFYALAETYKKTFEKPPWNAIYTDKESRKEMMHYFKYKRKIVQALYVGKQMAGFSIMTYEIKPYILDNGDKMKGWCGAEFCILPEFQGKGFGDFLFKKRIHELKKRDIKQYFFNTVNQLMVDLSAKNANVKFLGTTEVILPNNTPPKRNVYLVRFPYCQLK